MRITWWLHPGSHETERMQPDHQPGRERVGVTAAIPEAARRGLR